MKDDKHDCRIWLKYIGATVGGRQLKACSKCGRVFCPEAERDA